MTRSITHCEACASQTPAQFLFTKRGCDIYRCRDCGLGATQPQTDVDFSKVYDESYFNGKQDDGYADYAGSEEILSNEFRQTLKFIRGLVGPGHKRLLEIGSAHGFFLSEAHKDFDCIGLEFSESAAAIAKSRGLNVLQGAATADRIEALGRFDVIVMLDTIEHLPNPREVIEASSRQLDREGILVFTTGDFGSLYAKTSGSKWRLMTPPQHLFFFTEKSVRALGASAGLEVVEFGHPWKKVPLSLIAHQLPRVTGIKSLPVGAFMRSTAGIPMNLFDAMRVAYRKNQASSLP